MKQELLKDFSMKMKLLNKEILSLFSEHKQLLLNNISKSNYLEMVEK